MFGIHFSMQTRWTAPFPFLLSSPSPKPCTIRSGLAAVYDTIWSCCRVRYNLVLLLCTIQSGLVAMYDTIYPWSHVQYQSQSHNYYDTQY